MTFRWEKKTEQSVSRWYYVTDNDVPVALVEKFKDNRSTKNPFKVLLLKSGKFEPDAAFWPIEIPEPANVGYFKDYKGGMAQALERVENLFKGK